MIKEILKEISFREFCKNVEEQRDDLEVWNLWWGIQMAVYNMVNRICTKSLKEEGLL